jgi:hypothetical protein
MKVDYMCSWNPLLVALTVIVNLTVSDSVYGQVSAQLSLLEEENHVELSITSDQELGPTKIALNLSEGLELEGISLKGGALKMRGNEALLFWKSINSGDNKITLSMVVAEGVRELAVSGELTALVNGEKINSIIPSQRKRLSQNSEREEVKPNDTSMDYISLTENSISSSVNDVRVNTATTMEESKGKTATTEQASRNKTAFSSDSKKRFSVQISAGTDRLSEQRIEKLAPSGLQVRVVEDDGWFKYEVGDFNDYKEARALAESLRLSSNLPGPFVIAYNNGERLYVNELLKQLKVELRSLK